MSNTNFPQDGLRSSEFESPYDIIFGDSTSQTTPPIIISPPRQEVIDGSTPSPSPVAERIPQRRRNSLAQRLLSLVDPDGRPIRLVKRSALKDITNITKPRLSSVLGVDECVDDMQHFIYQSAEEFLPNFVSTPTCNDLYSDSGFFGPSSRFGDIFSPNNNAPTSIAPTAFFATLPESFKLSNFAGPMTPVSDDIVAYNNEYRDDYEDDVVAMGKQLEWEDEIRSF